MLYNTNARPDVERLKRGSRSEKTLNTVRAFVTVLVLIGAVSISVTVKASEQTQYKNVAGIGVYYGVLPAEVVDGHLTEFMNAGPLSDQIHLVVALCDLATSARIENAKVSAAVSPLGIGRPPQALNRMQISGTVTYGGFFERPLDDHLVINIEIDRPGTQQPVSVRFSYDRP